MTQFLKDQFFIFADTLKQYKKDLEKGTCIYIHYTILLLCHKCTAPLEWTYIPTTVLTSLTHTHTPSLSLSLSLSLTHTHTHTVKQEDVEYWENPQMFLASGPHGLYYTLHSFRATDALDSDDIKSIKIAGTLRYEVL